MVNFSLGKDGTSHDAVFCLSMVTMTLGDTTLSNSECLWTVRAEDDTTNCDLFFTRSPTTPGVGPTDTSYSYTSTICSNHFSVIHDWSTRALTFYVDGTQRATGFMMSASADAVGVAFLLRQEPVATRYSSYMDNLEISDIDIGELNEPSEFDSGLLSFITGLGFITPESQFFFAIIVIGITTVSTGVTIKFMAPGRLKLIVVASSAMLVGVFFAILDLYALWAFTLASVLGGVIVKGSGEFRNTFFELRGALDKIRAKSGEGEEEEAQEAVSGGLGKTTMEEVDDEPESSSQNIEESAQTFAPEPSSEATGSTEPQGA